MSVIHVEALCKSYRVAERDPGLLGAMRGLFHRRQRVVPALAGVSFGVDQGEVVAVLGPNGAGKSTLVKILSGILVPDGGACEVLGRSPWADRAAHVRDLGVVFGQRSQLWWDLPVGDGFALLADLYDLDPVALGPWQGELVERLGVGALLHTPVRQLSLGQRMRCELAAALLHRPRVLMLDEPTIGLDADAKLAVRELVAGIAGRAGVTVLLTSHDLDDVEALCRRILVVNHGRLVFDAGLADLRRSLGAERRLTIEGEGEPPQGDGVEVLSRDGGRWRLKVDTARWPLDRYIADLAAACRLRDLLVEDPPIEELVAELYRMQAP